MSDYTYTYTSSYRPHPAPLRSQFNPHPNAHRIHRIESREIAIKSAMRDKQEAKDVKVS